MKFKKYNNNPKGWKTGDCVIRAVALANNSDWDDTYAFLCNLGRSKCRMPNSKEVYEAFLKKEGWIKHKMPKHDNGKKYTVKELVELYPNKTLIISIPKHLTVAVSNELFDTWDCSNKYVCNYFTNEEYDMIDTTCIDNINKTLRKLL